MGDVALCIIDHAWGTRAFKWGEDWQARGVLRWDGRVLQVEYSSAASPGNMCMVQALGQKA